MLLNNLGYPRVGPKRELKFASENYWKGKVSRDDLFKTAADLRAYIWKTQAAANIDLIPCNDFSFYDIMLDMALLVGAIPERYQPVNKVAGNAEIDLYFAMARGYQKDGLDIVAMEMTKWFDTNYHYIVPEFKANQTFSLLSTKVFDEFKAAQQVLNRAPKPVLIGPISFLLLGKEKEKGFHRIDLLSKLLPVYTQILSQLQKDGAQWVQMDEPVLGLDISDKEKQAFEVAYTALFKACPKLKFIITTYFEELDDNLSVALKLPVTALHVDLVRAPQQLDKVLNDLPSHMSLSLGVIDGRNIWKNDYKKSLHLIEKAIAKIGKERVMIAPSCSLLHTPFDLDFEIELKSEIKNWMAFSKQKLTEMNELREILNGKTNYLEANQSAIESRRTSPLIHRQDVKQRVAAITDADAKRKSPFPKRQEIQSKKLKLPMFPTTTIGSFPQTAEVRSWRAKFKKGTITKEEYEQLVEKETERCIRIQEEMDLDVLVHGEFERNDMVEYFGEQLDGFVFTLNGWVQSYGSRGVKPPIIFGDVKRPFDMTVRWSSYAQSVTKRWMKGMLTGPVTILQWSFVRDDQPRSETAYQIALAIRDEAVALEKAGIHVIQIDEPAIREGLPLRRSKWNEYLNWAVKAFRVSSSGVRDETQVHTHMCYSEFNDIMEHIAAMDADAITIETSRSQMELLEAFEKINYPNEIGPGVYDIHSPRIPSKEEIISLLEKASAILPPRNVWVNPDCGLKTRGWKETDAALRNMVAGAKYMRSKFCGNGN
ncbi:5-methyltetrahydropteroyltriglutamate--homocysteine S-methyltransferase-like protein [Leptotrombidium deliense]|uniref:5-methyltetrahydropteroyltriglutamate--homocysteine S-methyltransferase n=1 Tax=Leptotrombidium deliense TaxID=299467 RepID=A0A443SFS0_9ACAR|nr:5-methyltetrahydropteroyltriglutamate--homocysteine S-methyltransferase-like protein [Leptotrombidium deliense]